MPDSIFNYPGTLAVIVALPAMGIIAKIAGASLERIAKWYCYAAVFAVLVMINSIFFPFIGGKDYYFRFSIELGLIAFMLWWAFEAKPGEVERLVKTTFKKPLVIAVSVFVLAVMLACIFALDSHAAFWSNYERGEGGFQMLHYYAFFLLIAMLFQREADWKNIFRFSLVAAGGMILYGVIANLGYPSFISPYTGSAAPAGWWEALTGGRFEGSLGNPAYVAPYLIFSMFFAGYLWIGSKISGTLTALKSWGYFLLIAVFFFFFYLAQTRGAFLGLDAGIFFFLGYLIFQESKFIKKLASAIVVISAILAFSIDILVRNQGFLGSVLAAGIVAVNVGIVAFLVCLAFSKDGFLRKWSRILLYVGVGAIVLGAIIFALFIHSFAAAQNLPGARSFQISADDTSAQTRFWVWGEAWKGFLARPIFGWGPENFTAVFDKYFNPNFFVPGQNTETWFDRAHSVFFDYLSETGILGFLSYLGIFFIFAREFFRQRKRTLATQHSDANAPALQNALILSLPVAYLVQGVAIFDVLPMYLSLFLFLGFMTYRLSNGAGK